MKLLYVTIFTSLFLLLLLSSCTPEQIKEYSTKEINLTPEELEQLVSEHAKIEYEEHHPSEHACGNTICEHYRLTLWESPDAGGAIFLNNVFHRIILKVVDSEKTATICVDENCGLVTVNETTILGGIEVRPEQIQFSPQFGNSVITMTFGENAQDCPQDCRGITGYCGDTVCTARKVTVKVGEAQKIIVDGAIIEVKLKSLVKDSYQLEIKGPGGIELEWGGQGKIIGGGGTNIPRKRKGFNPLDLFIVSYGGPSEMINLHYAVTDISSDSITLYFGDEARGDCADCEEVSGIR